MDIDLLEPIKAYKSKLKDKHYENTVKYFDDLVSKSGINVEENRNTIKKYKQTLIELDLVNKKIKKQKTKRGFVIAGIIILAIASLIYLFYAINIDRSQLVWSIIVLVVVLAIDILLVVYINKKINPIIKNAMTIQANLQNEATKLKQEAFAQMKGLNLLYDWNMSNHIINQTTKTLQLDEYFDVVKLEYLRRKFNLSDSNDPRVSVTHVQSGSIAENPFIIFRDYRQSFMMKTYTGSITIHWTEVVRTKDGTKTVHRSQVLTASIQRPVPVYSYVTYLLYGNDAAPNLIFSRGPEVAKDATEKELEKHVKKEVKKLNKKAKKELMDDDPNTNYTRFGNDEFESLFGGENRNNEIEYRLLFTPLAQKNLLSIIKDKEFYGDDFYFSKNKKINYIQSLHSQRINYKVDPSIFINFDYEAAKKFFIDFNVEYFKSIFFDLAPLLSIPIYQQTKPGELNMDMEYETNIPDYEHESIANSFDRRLLEPSGAVTDSIIKARIISKEGKYDKVNVTAHSFEGIPRIEIVTKYGGDGHLHQIPIHWVEYLPISKDTVMYIEKKDSSRLEYHSACNNNAFKSLLYNTSHVYERGLFAYLSDGEMKNHEGIDEIFKDNNGKKISSDDIRSLLLGIVEDVKDAVKANTSNSNINNSNNNNSNN